MITMTKDQVPRLRVRHTQNTESAAVNLQDGHSHSLEDQVPRQVHEARGQDLVVGDACISAHSARLEIALLVTRLLSNNKGIDI